MNETKELPNPIAALEFRRDQYGWNCEEMAKQLGMSKSKYSEVINGKRRLSLTQIRRAVKLGVPSDVLLQPLPCELESRRRAVERRIKSLKAQLKEKEAELAEINLS